MSWVEEKECRGYMMSRCLALVVQGKGEGFFVRVFEGVLGVLARVPHPPRYQRPRAACERITKGGEG